MKKSFSRYLHQHEYPRLLVRFPGLIRLLHGWNVLLLQRNKIVLRALKSSLKELPAGSIVADAGSGDGLHLFWFAKKYPELRFVGIDKNEAHILFCRKCALSMKLENLEFQHKELEGMTANREWDILLCVGTLQYVEDDELLLSVLAKGLKKEGILLLYVPVNGRAVLPWHERLFQLAEHYEKAQDRQRVYTPEEVFDKLKLAALEVSGKEFTYGTAGIIGHELYSMMLMGMGNAGLFWWVFAMGAFLLLPLILLLNAVDSFSPKSNGNGMLVVAKPVLT